MTRKPTIKRSKPSKNAAYEVGRGKPPKHTQFRKGKSGNLEGRPKGSKNLSTLIMEAAHGQVVATVDGKPRKISKIQATVMQLANKAAAGDQAAIGKLLDRIDEIETRSINKPAQFPFCALDLEVLHAAYERMKQCETEKPED